MYRLEIVKDGQLRLISDAKLSPEDFRAMSATRGLLPRQARKSGRISARRADHDEPIETRWNGQETSNVARPGDWIATNLDVAGTPLVDAHGNRNIYVITAENFARLYEPDRLASPALGALYRAKGTIDAIYFAGGLEIIAPWGEHQHIADGYLVLNGTEAYGNVRETFEATYTWLD